MNLPETKKARMLLYIKIQLCRHWAENQQVCRYLGEAHSPLPSQAPSQVPSHALSRPPSHALSNPPSQAPRKAPSQGLNLVPSKLQYLFQASWETKRLWTCFNHLLHQDQQLMHIRRASPSTSLKHQLLRSTQVSVLLLTKLQKELNHLSSWSWLLYVMCCYVYDRAVCTTIMQIHDCYLVAT